MYIYIFIRNQWVWGATDRIVELVTTGRWIIDFGLFKGHVVKKMPSYTQSLSDLL